MDILTGRFGQCRRMFKIGLKHSAKNYNEAHDSRFRKRIMVSLKYYRRNE